MENDTIARVGDNVLYKADIQKLLPPNYTLEDSVQIASNFVNSWALKKLIFLKAEENISEEKKSQFENLVQDYRTDLYVQSYMEMLIAKRTDTIISEADYQSFYDENKGIFRSNEELVKIRYLQVTEKDLKDKKLIERFKRFNNEDKKELDSLSIHYMAAFLNDSIWLKTSEVIEKLPFLQQKLPSRGGKINAFIQHSDSLGMTYLVKVSELLKKNEESPMEYIRPTLRQIILNKRKLNYIKELENEMINTAIKKKQFEIYE